MFVNNEVVDQVNISATSGDMGLLADHVPMISQLRPGVVDVIVGGKSQKKIFGESICAVYLERLLLGAC